MNLYVLEQHVADKLAEARALSARAALAAAARPERPSLFARLAEIVRPLSPPSL